MPKFMMLAMCAAFALTANAGFADARPGTRLCKAKVPSTGKVKAWRCKTDEPCCVTPALEIYVCGSPVTGCL